MHIEILVEDQSGHRFLEFVVPEIIGPFGDPHTWRIKAYKGIGRLPPDLKPSADPAKRLLLDQLPKLLRGYARTPGIDHVVVLVDADRRDCTEFLTELRDLANRCFPSPNVLFRIAIEEVEAWYLGDQHALLQAYPKAKREILSKYSQDEICGTWELLADSIHPGGSAALKKLGYQASGRAKSIWAERIARHMNVEINMSLSFKKFRDGLRRIIA